MLPNRELKTVYKLSKFRADMHFTETKLKVLKDYSVGSLQLTLRSRSLKGSACHGISLKYSLKLFSSRSELTKMISMLWLFSFSLVYSWAKTGVNPRQGGHQCAEKYKPGIELSYCIRET